MDAFPYPQLSWECIQSKLLKGGYTGDNIGEYYGRPNRFGGIRSHALTKARGYHRDLTNSEYGGPRCLV